METNKNNPDEMPLSPEEIKAIGEIQIGPAKHEVFLNNHYKKLIVGGIALIVAATAGIAYYAYNEQQQEDAGALIVKSVGATAVDSTMQPQNYDPQALEAVITDYDSTASVETAKLLKAMREITDPANSDLSSLVQLASSAQNEVVRVRANVALASHFTSLGDDDKAIRYWKAVADMPRSAYSALAYINLCDLCWKKGDTIGASDYLRRAQDAYPESAFFALNRRNDDMVVRMDLLEKGVDDPKPNNDIFNAPADAQTPAPSAGAATDPLFTETPSAAPSTLPDLNMPSTLPADIPVDTPPVTPAAPAN
ncbi:MAG: tetratricopeptide repeat protein [Akkermansia sp.]|nr:tetratricopeptide repeat protein [Akkermansia sp.]